MKSLFIKEAENNFEYMKKVRTYLHQHPEIGFELKETTDFVLSELKNMGYTPKKCGKSGIVATIGDESKKAILLRCDMDGLSIKEESDINYPSKNGNMHACGHDMHTAMLLGCAKILKKYEKDLKGLVKLMFQPAEEILEGSLDMIESGALENPSVDVAIMVHVMTNVPFKCGTVIVSPEGVTAPASQFFTITVKGKGTHGSMPDKGVDPITIASYIVIALQELKTRELAISDSAMITFGSFNGGVSSNVIPDTVVLKGTFRAFDDDVQMFIKRRLQEISENIAFAFRGDADVLLESGCPTLLNNEKLSLSVNEYMEDILGKDMVFSAENMKGEKSSGSEDFSYISHKVPSLMVAISAGERDEGYDYPLHPSKVKFDEKALINGSLIYAYSAFRWLEENDN